MALFLVQHGLSASKDVDPKRGLTNQGIIDSERIAKLAREYGIKVGKIIHSGKSRAEQTASIFHKVLSVPRPLEIVSGINPLDDVRIFAETIQPESELMVIGHLPFLQRLLAYLTTGSEKFGIYQFQNSGIVCLSTIKEASNKTDWIIKWTLNPNIS